MILGDCAVEGIKDYVQGLLAGDLARAERYRILTGEQANPVQLHRTAIGVGYVVEGGDAAVLALSWRRELRRDPRVRRGFQEEDVVGRVGDRDAGVEVVGDVGVPDDGHRVGHVQEDGGARKYALVRVPDHGEVLESHLKRHRRDEGAPGGRVLRERPRDGFGRDLLGRRLIDRQEEQDENEHGADEGVYEGPGSSPLLQELSRARLSDDL